MTLLTGNSGPGIKGMALYDAYTNRGLRLAEVDGNLRVPVSLSDEQVPVNTVSTTSFNSRDAATLAAGATFQGVSEDVSKYATVRVAIHSDNATDATAYMEVSHDNVIWSSIPRSVADTTSANPIMWTIVESYYRLRYVNGTTEATNLSILTQYSSDGSIFLGHPLNETLIDEQGAILTRAIIGGQAGASEEADSVYRNVSVDVNNHLDVVPHGHPEGGHVLFKKTFSATEDVIVIDVSDTTNYPHAYTSWIHTSNMLLEIDASSDAEYVIKIGFLENVDGTDGDFHEIFEIDGSRKAGNSHFLEINQAPESPQLRSAKFTGPVVLNDTAFQTDVNLRSTLDPTGAAATPSGSGDMVMRVTHTAGTYTVECMIGYHSHGA